MRANACGKDCAACGEYLAEKCIGCGEETTALCAIACCAEKKCFDKCTECWKNDDCKKLPQKDKMPVLRRENLRYAAERCVWAQENAKPLRLWLTVLAVLAMLRGVALLLSLPVEALLPIGAQVPPHLFAPQTRLAVAVCHVMYGVVLLMLSRLQEKYRFAGICIMFSGVVMAVQAYLKQGEALSLAVSVVYLLLCFVGEYYECAAHADTALGIDRAVAENWGRIWKWIVGGQVVLMAAYPLLFYALPLAAMIMIGLLIALPRIYRRKILRIWQMAQTL